MSTNPSTANGTQTDVPCTLNTCPLSEAIITYQPNIAGNAFFSALFGILLLVQLGLGIRHKTWSYLVAMVFGLVLEIVGYVGRIQLHDDPFNFNSFIQYLVCITIAPAFFTAAIYITWARVVHSCDEKLSWIRPERISIIFMTCDVVCLVLQATGGAITATYSAESREAAAMRQTGVNTMIGGLSFQVVSLSFFILYAAIYAWRWHAATVLHYRHRLQSARTSLRWRSLVFGLAVASVTILVRCIFRVAELRTGFKSRLANDQVAYMVLEGTMIIISCLCLTLGHPGLCLDIACKLPKQGPQRRRNAVPCVDLENMHIRKK